MTRNILHINSLGKIIQYTNSEDLYPVNSYQSLVLASASEYAAHMLALRTDRKLADLKAWEPCCGGGPVAVALKSIGIGYVQASDINPAALEACRDNATQNGPDLDRIVQADLLEDTSTDRFDLICCNPPCGVQSFVKDISSDDIRRSVDGGTEGMEQTINLLQQAPSHLTDSGSIVLIAVSTGSVLRLIRTLNDLYPDSWRVLPSTPVAAPWTREDNERATRLFSDDRHFRPFVWKRGDGWFWRLSWVIEATTTAGLFPETKGLPLQPYGHDISSDTGLAETIAQFSTDGYWLRDR